MTRRTLFKKTYKYVCENAIIKSDIFLNTNQLEAIVDTVNRGLIYYDPAYQIARSVFYGLENPLVKKVQVRIRQKGIFIRIIAK